MLTWALLASNPVQLIAPEQLRLGLIQSFKLLHIGGYAIFAILTGWLHAACWLRWPLLGFLIVHAFGTEVMQSLMGVGRTGSPRDMGLDSLGIAIGVMLTWPWWWKWKQPPGDS